MTLTEANLLCSTLQLLVRRGVRVYVSAKADRPPNPDLAKYAVTIQFKNTLIELTQAIAYVRQA